MDIKAQLETIVGTGRIGANYDLAPFTTLKTKSKARFFFEATSRDDLIAADCASRKTGIPLFVLGGGSNLVITTERLDALVVHNRYIAFDVLSHTEELNSIAVSSGYPVNLLVQKTIELGLSGLEYHLGLPGTVGGALYMNSKWTRPPVYFGDQLTYANIIDEKGAVTKKTRDYFDFAYDHSIIQETKEVLLEAVFSLKRESPTVLKRRAAEALAYRKQTQPFGVFSSGCFFRNITPEDQRRAGLPTTSAGYLIDRAGLKGSKMGGFYVSPLHANFILNKGDGKAADLMALLAHIKQRVKEKFGIELREEVILMT